MRHQRVRIKTHHEGIKPGVRTRAMDTTVELVTYDEEGKEIDTQRLQNCVWLRS